MAAKGVDCTGPGPFFLPEAVAGFPVRANHACPTHVYKDTTDGGGRGGREGQDGPSAAGAGVQVSGGLAASLGDGCEDRDRVQIQEHR